jgi:hypothetical protein
LLFANQVPQLNILLNDVFHNRFSLVGNVAFVGLLLTGAWFAGVDRPTITKQAVVPTLSAILRVSLRQLFQCCVSLFFHDCSLVGKKSERPNNPAKPAKETRLHLFWIKLFGNELDSGFLVVKPSQFCVVTQRLFVPCSFSKQLGETLINLHVDSLLQKVRASP